MRKIINKRVNRFINQNDGYISVKNDGYYHAIVEIQFYLNEEKLIYRSNLLSRGKGTEVTIPSNAKQIRFTAYYSNGISYKVICTKTFDDAEVRCYQLEGSLFNPSCKEVPCHGQNSNNIKINCQCCCKKYI